MDACLTYIQEVGQAYPDAAVHFAVGDTYLNRDGMYDHITHTITVHKRVCDKPDFYIKWVVLHELGHHVAVANGDFSEESADFYSKIWYGNASLLLKYSSEKCESTQSQLYCYISKQFKD